MREVEALGPGVLRFGMQDASFRDLRRDLTGILDATLACSDPSIKYIELDLSQLGPIPGTYVRNYLDGYLDERIEVFVSAGIAINWEEPSFQPTDQERLRGYGEKTRQNSRIRFSVLSGPQAQIRTDLPSVLVAPALSAIPEAVS